MQSIDSIEKHPYGTSKAIIYVKEKTKRYNIKQKCLASIIFQRKT